VQVLEPAGGGQGREGNGLGGREAGGHCADRKDVGGNSEGGQVDKDGQQDKKRTRDGAGDRTSAGR
jgi:hypothetical protein